MARHAWQDHVLKVPQRVLGVTYHEMCVPVQVCVKCGVMKKELYMTGIIALNGHSSWRGTIFCSLEDNQFRHASKRNPVPRCGA